MSSRGFRFLTISVISSYSLDNLFTKTNSLWLTYQSIKTLEAETSMVFNLVFGSNKILLCFFFFFWLINLYSLIPAVIEQILNPTTELLTPIGIPNKEAKAGLVFVNNKISSCLFFFFLIIDLYFLIPAVIAQILNPTTGLLMPTRRTHLRQFTIDSTSKFHVESSSRFYGFWKVNPRETYDILLTWKFRCGFDFQNRQVLHVDFPVPFQRWIDVTAVLTVSILSFPNIFCSGNLF